MFFILGFAFLITSCNKNEEATDEQLYPVTVLGRGLDCGDAHLIKFDENVPGLPGNTFDNIYYEINLPNQYKVPGTKIKVKFREPEEGELMLCTTMGPGYPQLFILKVELEN